MFWFSILSCLDFSSFLILVIFWIIVKSFSLFSDKFINILEFCFSFSLISIFFCGFSFFIFSWSFSPSSFSFSFISDFSICFISFSCLGTFSSSFSFLIPLALSFCFSLSSSFFSSSFSLSSFSLSFNLSSCSTCSFLSESSFISSLLFSSLTLISLSSLIFSFSSFSLLSFFITPEKNKLSILSLTNSIFGFISIIFFPSFSLFSSLKSNLFFSKLFLLINSIIYSSLILIPFMKISSVFLISFSAFFFSGRFKFSFFSFSWLNKVSNLSNFILSIYKLSVFCISNFFLIKGSIHILQVFSIFINSSLLKWFNKLFSLFVFSIKKLSVNCFCNGSLSFGNIIKLIIVSGFISFFLKFFSKVISNMFWISYSGTVIPSIIIRSIISYSKGPFSFGSIYKFIFCSIWFIYFGFNCDFKFDFISRLIASASNIEENLFSILVEGIFISSNFCIEFGSFSFPSINNSSTNWFSKLNNFFSGKIVIFISWTIEFNLSFLSGIDSSNKILSIFSNCNGVFSIFCKLKLSKSSIS